VTPLHTADQGRSNYHHPRAPRILNFRALLTDPWV
jgi:hypothetical protein